MSLRCVLGICLLLVATPLQGQQSPTGKDTDALPASTAPAVIEIEVALAEWATNPPEAGKETPNELSGSIDEVQQRISALEKARKLMVLERFRLTTLDGFKAVVHAGERVPVTQGVAMGSFGTTRNVADRLAGTVVTVKPSVPAGDLIQMELGFGKHSFVTRPDAPLWVDPQQGVKIPATGETGIDLKTTVRIASGTTTLITGHSSDGRHHLLIVSATIR